jgi:hypothetical protein
MLSDDTYIELLPEMQCQRCILSENSQKMLSDDTHVVVLPKRADIKHFQM